MTGHQIKQLKLLKKTAKLILLMKDMIKKFLLQYVVPGICRRIDTFCCFLHAGLAVEGGSFIRPEDKGLVEKLEDFNKSQNYSILYSALKS